jgi:hypothetical protein
MFSHPFALASAKAVRPGVLAGAAMVLAALAGGGPWAQAQNQIWAVPGGADIRVIEPVFRMHRGSPSLLAFTAEGRRLVRWHLDREGRPHQETLAGTGDGEPAPDGTPATATALEASAIAQGASGETFFLETTRNRLRKIGFDRCVWTVAGTGEAGFSGDGGPGPLARLDRPQGLVASGTGDLYIADTENQRIRKLAADGTITTFAGTGDQGNPYQTSQTGPATLAHLRKPIGLALCEGALHLSHPAYFGGEVWQVSLATGKLEAVRRLELNAWPFVSDNDNGNDHYVCSAMALTGTGETYVLSNNNLYMKGSFRVIRLPSGGGADAHQPIAGTQSKSKKGLYGRIRWPRIPGFRPSWDGGDALAVTLGRIRSLMVADGVGCLFSTDDAGLLFLDGVVVPPEARLATLEREGKDDQVREGIQELRRQALGRTRALEEQLTTSAPHLPRGVASLILGYDQTDPQAEMMRMFRARLRLNKIREIPRLRRFLG